MALQSHFDGAPVGLFLGLAFVHLASSLCRADDTPRAIVREVEPVITMPQTVDSNSPAHWSEDAAHLFNSAFAPPFRSSGPGFDDLSEAHPVDISGVDYQARGGHWLESVFKAPTGRLYGWYHNEPPRVCTHSDQRGRDHLTSPRIGAAWSDDDGAHWHDLGIVLEAPPATDQCHTQNGFFAGGEGDFWVIVDAQREFVYFLFSAYHGQTQEQGVGVARMSYGDLDRPIDPDGQSRVAKWHAGSFGEPGLSGRATPIFGADSDWHTPGTQAFWGPSVHWNTYLESYVVLLNRAKDADFSQEGVYISFNRDLADPAGWTAPQKVMNGGAWYPQVLGMDRGARETDTVAGRVARLFIGGISRWEIEFVKHAQPQ